MHGIKRVVAVVLLAAGCATDEHRAIQQVNQFEPVNTSQAATRIITPVNQVLTPVGIQVPLPGMRPQAIALSPDGRLLVTAGKTHDLVVVNPDSGDILQKVALPSE